MTMSLIGKWNVSWMQSRSRAFGPGRRDTLYGLSYGTLPMTARVADVVDIQQEIDDSWVINQSTLAFADHTVTWTTHAKLLSVVQEKTVPFEYVSCLRGGKLLTIAGDAEYALKTYEGRFIDLRPLKINSTCVVLSPRSRVDRDAQGRMTLFIRAGM